MNTSTLSPTAPPHWRLSFCFSLADTLLLLASKQVLHNVVLRATYFLAFGKHLQIWLRRTEQTCQVPTQILPLHSDHVCVFVCAFPWKHHFSSLPSDRWPFFNHWSACLISTFLFYTEMSPNCYYIRFPEIWQCRVFKNGGVWII